MRCDSAASAKGIKVRGAPRQEAPRIGTRLREVYDLFQANKGIPVELSRANHSSSMMIRLTDFYGLDIRLVKQGHCGVGRLSTYVLAGEWFGKVYVDYIAERLKSPLQVPEKPLQHQSRDHKRSDQPDQHPQHNLNHRSLA